MTEQEILHVRNLAETGQVQFKELEYLNQNPQRTQ